LAWSFASRYWHDIQKQKRNEASIIGYFRYRNEMNQLILINRFIETKQSSVVRKFSILKRSELI
jgi:hypothetical protein